MGMEPERWRQVQDILLDLLHEPRSRRGRILTARYAEDPTLQAELRELLQAAHEGEGYFSDLAHRAGLKGSSEGREAIEDLLAPTYSDPGRVDQDVRYCEASDGVHIAYATIGEGPPLVKVANWLSHLEFDAQSPVWSHWLRELSRDHQLVRYDERGCGLSDWDVDFSFDAWVLDLETVVDSLGLERFALLGISAGGAIAIAYAARHPERVSKLILQGAFALGWNRRDLAPGSLANFEAMRTLMLRAWGRSNPAFRQMFTTLFIPEATPEQADWFNELQKESASPENAVRFQGVFSKLDVIDELAQVQAPTLLLHSRGDAMVPFKLCREIATRIPDCRVVQLDSKNHLLLEHEPAWQVFLGEARRFLGVQTADPEASIPGVGARGVRSDRRTDLSRDPLDDGPIPDFWSHAPARLRTRFDLVREIARGGMATVYLAHDRKHDRPVALKVFDPDALGEIGVKRFQREILVMSGLQHPHVLPLLDSGALSDRLYYVMPFVDGPSLAARIRDAAPLGRSEALSIAREVAAALDFAHRQGVVHRDIKPGNILLSDGHAVVADFGIAYMVHDASSTLTKGSIIGTPTYMSPEQISGAALDHRSDVYSLACFVYEMLTGRPPHAGSLAQLLQSHLEGYVRPLTESRPDLSRAADRAMARGLAKAPADRFETASALVEALDAT